MCLPTLATDLFGNLEQSIAVTRVTQTIAPPVRRGAHFRCGTIIDERLVLKRSGTFAEHGI